MEHGEERGSEVGEQDRVDGGGSGEEAMSQNSRWSVYYRLSAAVASGTEQGEKESEEGGRGGDSRKADDQGTDAPDRAPKQSHK